MGPQGFKILVEGKISSTPFRETISLTQGQRRIDIGLIIDWKENIGIGKFNDSANTRQPVKAFYDDRYKLLALFPVSFKAEKLYKNAPFDVTESVDKNSFFTRWDSIKNNVLLNWADISDVHHKYGLALLSDHCTNYIKGEEYPFGFTLQYSGNGLFSRNYTIEGPSEINYAIVPHEGKWDNSGIWQESANWNEPLVALTDSGVGKKSQSFVDVTNTGYELSSLTCEGKIY
jgi:alpha-mannosidase